MYEHRTRRRIEFADTDMAGIVHFARFFIFMETAEHEFLEQLGVPVHFEHEGRPVGWPRLAASCQYKSPARLGEVLDIVVRVKRKGRRSMTWSVVFTREGTLIAEGELSTICCLLGQERREPTRLEPIPIPAFLADQIDEPPESLGTPSS